MKIFKNLEELIDANETITIVVHDGVFHADDVLAVALLRYAMRNQWGEKELDIIRTRNPETIETANIVLDVGMTDIADGNIIKFDHHQPDSQSYENGIKMAACGKLAAHIFNDIDILERLKPVVFYPVEAQDNGQEYERPNPLDFVRHLNAVNIYSDEQTNQFMLAVNITVEILASMIDHIKFDIETEEHVTERITDATEKNSSVLILDMFCPSWKRQVVEYNLNHYDNMIMSCIFKGNDGKWTILNVPESLDSFNAISYAPEEWRGLSGEELREVSGLNLEFCHKAGFMAIANDFNSAIAASLKFY